MKKKILQNLQVNQQIDACVFLLTESRKRNENEIYTEYSICFFLYSSKCVKSERKKKKHFLCPALSFVCSSAFQRWQNQPKDTFKKKENERKKWEKKQKWFLFHNNWDQMN